jgi:hypothetical protein
LGCDSDNIVWPIHWVCPAESNAVDDMKTSIRFSVREMKGRACWGTKGPPGYVAPRAAPAKILLGYSCQAVVEMANMFDTVWG